MDQSYLKTCLPKYFCAKYVWPDLLESPKLQQLKRECQFSPDQVRMARVPDFYAKQQALQNFQGLFQPDPQLQKNCKGYILWIQFRVKF